MSVRCRYCGKAIELVGGRWYHVEGNEDICGSMGWCVDESGCEPHIESVCPATGIVTHHEKRAYWWHIIIDRFLRK